MAPLIGLRQKPGWIALTVFRIVPLVFRLRLGGLLGRTFLLLTYRGRKSGEIYRAALMVLAYDRSTEEVTSLAMYGSQTGWLRNILASPALAVQVGGETYRPIQRVLSEDEAVSVLRTFRQAHPGRVALATRVMGWGRLRTEREIREFVRRKPLVAFSPAPAEQAARTRAAV